MHGRSMKHSVSHDLGREKARKVADAALASYKEKLAQYEPQATWVSETKADINFRVKGFTLSGTLGVTDTSIDMELAVPFLLRPFQGTALGVIEREIGVWLNKAKTGEI